jgi:HD-like signal output (HDOD) protein
MTDTVDTPPAPSPVDALLESSLKDIGIPPRPAILERISSEMLKDEPDFKRLANIIGADVSLAAGLIKTANSPFFGTRGRVRSVNEALVMLGLDVASRAIAGIILRKVFPASLHLERFWDASARIARLSGWLAKQVGRNKLRQDDAYTFGLFRDCGIPVLLMRFPGYGRVLAAANAEERQGFTAIEDAQLPTNHAMVGCLLAQSWWLPEETCLAIRHHHDARGDRNPIHQPAAHQPLPHRHGATGRTPGAAAFGTLPDQRMAQARRRLPAPAGRSSESQVDAIIAESVPILDAEE